MKRTKIRLIALMITLAAVVTGLSAEAQRRAYRSDRHDRNDRYERKDKHDRHDRNYHHKSEKYSHNKHKHHRDGHHKSHKYYKKHREYKYYDRHRYHDHYRYRKPYHGNCYSHPRYGVVYRKFYSTPLRLRHHDCDYYYHGGHYYRHHHGVGYVRVELPGHIVFEHLPGRCERFSHRGYTYYRHGDIVFKRYRHGYRVVPSFGVQFSMHF